VYFHFYLSTVLTVNKDVQYEA